jgi:hypothetical protein
MSVILDDMDLASVRNGVAKYGHGWEIINLHPAGVGYFLLPTINA